MYTNYNEDLAYIQSSNFLQENLDNVVSMLRINQKHLIAESDGFSTDNEYEESRWLDVRLNYRDGSLNLYTGDPSFDTNHNGFWASSSLSAYTICEELALELLTDLIENTYC